MILKRKMSSKRVKRRNKHNDHIKQLGLHPNKNKS